MAQPDDFQAWYSHEYGRLLAAIVVLAGDLDLAQDVAAEACTRCLVVWPTDRRPADPTAWTYRVAVNLLKRTWRRRLSEEKILASLERIPAVTIPEPAIEVWRAIAQLPNRARTAIVLRYVGGMTEAEVADVMGIAPGTAAATLSTARRRLAVLLDDDQEVADVRR
jgi:RNA polymerase sigma-70 factor (ECF subfamily)